MISKISSRQPPSFRFKQTHRALLVGFPLVVWLFIALFALNSFASKPIRKEGHLVADPRFEQEHCTLLQWKCRESADIDQPHLRIDAQKAVTQCTQNGEFEETLKAMRLFCKYIPAMPVLAHCATATYSFSSRCLSAQNINWWLYPDKYQLPKQVSLPQPTPPSQLGFGECRNLKVHFQASKPRFEMTGFTASAPLPLKSFSP